jgi:adenosine deaminase
MSVANLYQLLPKVELHLHLDCSLSLEVVNILDPSITEDIYNKEFKAPLNCCNLLEYIQCAERSIQLMQTKEQLRLVTLDLFKQLKADNVIYAEIRFAPLQHLQQGLTPYEVVQVVNDATDEGIKMYGIEAGVILCTLRHYTQAESLQTVELVEAFKNTHIVGFDIAADEVGFPIDNHIAAFEYAAKKYISCTAHAGEAKGPESVWETLNHLKPSRIGHGVRSIEDKNLINFLIKENIHLEVCPTSNIVTKVYDSLDQHQLNNIFELGVSMSINTDGRTISNVSLTEEYQSVEHIFKWTLQHFKKCNEEAIGHAFATQEIKNKIIKQIEAAYKQ